MQNFKENCVIILEFQKEAPDSKGLDSDEDAAPSIRSRSPFIIKETINRDVFSRHYRSNKPEKAYNQNHERSKLNKKTLNNE